MSTTIAEAALVTDTDRVEMVISCVEPGHYRAATSAGSCEFRRGDAGYEVLTGTVAGHAITFLFDGLNANLLCDAIDAGDVPVSAGLLDNGTCYREGLVASLPSVTLPNHTTLITGVHPGHHGILSNEWLDRNTGQAHSLLELSQMVKACEHLLPGVEAIFEAIARTYPNAFCAATYEYADRGADWSTYAEVRAERRPEGVPRRGERIPDATVRWVEDNPKYRFISRIDIASAMQACMLLDPAAETPPPKFLWVNFSLTDEPGHHSGPYGEEARDALRDTDTRMGHVLEAARQAGTLHRTAVFMMADHGMELTNPQVAGHYHPALDAAGVPYRDLDDGLIYLG